MICKTRSPRLDHERVIFELPATLWADRVFVVGDFNQGSPIPLQQTDNGAWRAVLDLPTGHQYHFRYLVDGEWRADFQADGYTIADGLPTSLLNLT